MAISKKIEKALEGASWIRKMFEEGDKLKRMYGPEKIFDFSLGNPIAEPPGEFFDELRKIANNPIPGMCRYMTNNGYEETRKSIASLLSEETGFSFTERQIIMSTGAAGGLNIALKSILDPGDEVITSCPYFVEYRFYMDNHGGTLKTVDSRDDFSLDLLAIEGAINKKTKAVIINSPNNPTGVVYDKEPLIQLGQILGEKSAKYGRTIFLLCDEAYKRIVYDSVKLPDVFSIYDHCISVISHSKDLSIPGERIGYVAISPSADGKERLADAMTFANRTLGFVNAPALMQRLVGRLTHVSVDISEYQEKRDLFYNGLVDFGYSIVKPMGAFYLFPRCPIDDDVAFVRALQAKNILTAPGRGFGRPGHIRIAYCVERRVIEASLEGFRELAIEYGMR
ncbi:MAG: pyridoxal phosphate-dependent aminotransferase [Syntrophobacterales bacterium]|nr:MAG: pyridoxal phosphate-dependent aminotransferase [Syntrophobacterales bacterium]